MTILSTILLILAFPDFEYWFLAWFALVPLLLAVEREKNQSFDHLPSAGSGASVSFLEHPGG